MSAAFQKLPVGSQPSGRLLASHARSKDLLTDEGRDSPTLELSAIWEQQKGRSEMLATATLDSAAILRKAHATGLLEYVCQELELSDTQFKLAQERYGAVGTWLAEAENYVTRSAAVYPQGSVALGTTVKPIGREEYDVDLVCLVALAGHLAPAELKKTVGDRLRLNGRYREILEEKRRCWRLNYAGEFHLDITPSIPNPNCGHGGELVPDKRLQQYKPTNPKGYRAWFDLRARLQPRIITEKIELREMRAQIESLPAPTRFRGLLRRCVQICKRNRDVCFADNPGNAPISIIITTLAAKSYADCVSRFEYETDLDVLIDVVRRMHSFIETTGRNGERGWFLWNETTDGENFAEKWNQDAALVGAFLRWQRQAVQTFEQLAATVGMDQVSKQLSEAFGEVGSRAVRKLADEVSAARAAGRLGVLPGVGLIGTAARGTAMRSNTFFGANEG